MLRRAERGSATIYVLAMVLLLMAVALGVAGFAGLATAKHRALAAADLAALAAATSAAGCDLAVTTAARNGGRLVGCVREGSEVSVTVEVVGRAPFGLRSTMQARARAGPAPTGGPSATS
jgi:secretion/DNA translocation related TadE-like protein